MMGQSRQLRRRCSAVLAIFLAALGATFGFSAPVGAAEEASGSAFGLSADGLIDIEPEPEAAFPPGGTDSTIEIDLGGLLLACTLNASSQGFDGDGDEVDNVADAESVESSASVESATLLGNPDADCENGDDDSGSGGLVDFLDDLVDELLDGTGIAITAIASECVADENGASGSSTVVGLDGGGDILDDLLGDGLDLNDLAVDLGLDLGVDLGILELELDEQIEDADGNGITVRALRLTLLPGDGGDEPLQEVILAESQCRFLGDDDDPDPGPGGGDNDARNESDISNESDGTAVIETGDASAVGNISRTRIDQAAGAAGAGFFGGAGVDQDASVVNEGSAGANTGLNTAIGNNSLNVADNTQTATAVSTTTGTTVAGANTAGNASTATNTSGGTAVIGTGDADAVGNISDTEIGQAAAAAGAAFFGGAGVDQDATVVNAGDAGANTGGNIAVGNGSTNVATNDQVAVAVGDDSDGDNTAGNASTATNTSDGTAVIGTGDADAVGNISDTRIGQAADAAGNAFLGGVNIDQDATVVNVGEAGANTGGNIAVGNDSTNVATNDQVAVAVGDDSDGDNTAGNASTATNTSDGTAVIETGDADALGSVSDTEIDQAGSAVGGTGGSPCGGTCEPCGECPEECPDPEPECPADCDPEPTPCQPSPCDNPCDDDDPCPCRDWTRDYGWGRGFGSSSVDQSATVVNSGSANANTGGNTAVGNNSTNVVSNNQTAVAADD